MCGNIHAACYSCRYVSLIRTKGGAESGGVIGFLLTLRSQLVGHYLITDLKFIGLIMLKKLLITLLASFALMGVAFAAVDLNTANQAQLESLTGIGPAKAKDIIDFRTKNGLFKSAEDVMKVPGIKAATYSKIKGEISVGGKAAAASAPSAAAKTDKMLKASAPAKK